jgi:hypothetical protein
LAPKGVFVQKFVPLEFFDQDFGPLAKEIAIPGLDIYFLFFVNF